MQPDEASYDFENGYVGIEELKPILTAALLTPAEMAALPKNVDALCTSLQTKSFSALATTSSF